MLIAPHPLPPAPSLLRLTLPFPNSPRPPVLGQELQTGMLRAGGHLPPCPSCPQNWKVEKMICLGGHSSRGDVWGHAA